MTRTYLVTFTDGTEQTFPDITRSVLEPAALSLYRRDKPSAAEEHVASLPLVGVRMWVKTP